MNGVHPSRTEWHRVADYLLKTEISDIGVKILLTNSRYLWQTFLSKDDLIKLAKTQNHTMEASDERFLSAATDLLHSEQNNLECRHKENMTTVTCSLKTSLQDLISFSLSVELAQTNADEYYKEITFPLLASIHQVQIERDELMKIIQAKDAEIGEYKLAGATLFRKGVATKYFNKEEFLKSSRTKSAAGDKPFQADSICQDTLKSFKQISALYETKDEKKDITVKMEPGILPSCEPSVSSSPTKRRVPRPESPVLNLPKRPRTGKLAKLI